jgi:hypothetical protein
VKDFSKVKDFNMPYALQIMDPGPTEGQYLERFDLEAHSLLGPYPTGYVWFTPTVERALLFDTVELALETWNRQSHSTPLRPDGQPNRPLTAFTMAIVSVKKRHDASVEQPHSELEI